jgi:dTDP-4-amino-4,6-dideoxygalactose transaminase
MIRLADPRFGDDALTAIAGVLASGRLTQGPSVEGFERAIAELCGARHAVATTSATTAIELTLAAIGIGPGDDVAVADFTWPATGNAVLQRGAQPRLADADPETYCVAPAALERALTDHTKAAIAVDVFGLPADYRTIEPLLADRGIPLVCDAACALGGAIWERRVGRFGLATCFSFHPRKSLTTGEGGMVVTDDDALADQLRLLRNHGVRRDGWRATFVEPGFNFRMSDLNAALGLVQVPRHPATVRRRGQLAANLCARLADVPGLRPQAVPEGFLHPYQSFVVVLEDERLERNAVIAELRELGVESTLGTYAMHAEPAFMARCGTRPGELPNSHTLAERTLALPLHERLEETDLETIAAAVASVTRSRARTS